MNEKKNLEKSKLWNRQNGIPEYKFNFSRKLISLYMQKPHKAL